MMKLNKGTAFLSKRGIEFDGHYYSCRRAIREQWFAEVRGTEKCQLDIHYIPGILNEVYMEIDSKWVTCFKVGEPPRATPEVALYFKRLQTLRNQLKLLKNKEGGN